jgi:hypothetical protein
VSGAPLPWATTTVALTSSATIWPATITAIVGRPREICGPMKFETP